MPQRVTRSVSSLPRVSVEPKKSPRTTTPAWTARVTARTTETPVDRWQRLHAPVLQPVVIKSRTISAEAKQMTGIAAKEAQEIIDALNGYGLAEPMWPHFKSMGFRETDAGMLREALKRFDASRRTSLVGVARLEPRAANTQKLAALVDALIAGKSGAAELAKLPKQFVDVLSRAGESRQERAANLLEAELSHFITDSPVDLVDGNTAVIQQGLSAAIRAETSRLAEADDATLRKMKHEGLSSIGLLRELAVLNPREAQTLGAAFASALHAAE